MSIAEKFEQLDASKVVLADREFKRLKELVGKRTGIVITDAKRDMIRGRLVKRLRALGLTCFAEYCLIFPPPQQAPKPSKRTASKKYPNRLFKVKTRLSIKHLKIRLNSPHYWDKSPPK